MAMCLFSCFPQSPNGSVWIAVNHLIKFGSWALFKWEVLVGLGQYIISYEKPARDSSLSRFGVGRDGDYTRLLLYKDSQNTIFQGLSSKSPVTF